VIRFPAASQFTYPTKHKRFRVAFPRSALRWAHVPIRSDERLEKERAPRPHPKALKRQIRAIGGVSEVGPDPKLGTTGFTPTLRPAPDRQHWKAAPRSYVRDSVAICNYVTIYVLFATHPRLRVSASIGHEPRVEIALV
jgi:hypothetical protein